MAFGSFGNNQNDGCGSNRWWIVVIAIVVVYFLFFDDKDCGSNSPCPPPCGC